MSLPAQRRDDLSGSDKAAALLMALPAEESASVLRHLAETHVERVTLRMLKHDSLALETQEDILREAHTLALAQDYIATGGVDYARKLLTQALGSERAGEIVDRLVATMQSQPFHYLNDVDPMQIATFVRDEHPQIVALILSYLRVNHTADVLSMLPEGLQPQVSMRLAHMDAINPVVVTQIETALRKKLSSVLQTDKSKTGGVDFLVRVLTQVDRGTERAILEELDESSPELAADIRKQMFVFENLTMLDDRGIQRVLRDVDGKDLTLALRGGATAVRDHIFKNMSQRAAEMLREELEASPPVRLKNVEEAQQRIVAVVRRLEDEEEIVIARGGGDVMV